MPINKIIDFDQLSSSSLVDPKEESLPKMKEVLVSPKEIQKNKITIGFVGIEKSWDRNEISIDDIFSFIVALNITNDDGDLDPRIVEECRHRNNWPKWKNII